MSKKINKDKKEPSKKIGLSIKEVIPPLPNKNPRELLPIQHPESFIKKYEPEYIPFEIFPEWVSDEAAQVYKINYFQNFDYSAVGEDDGIFRDSFKIHLPYSIASENPEIKWIRPERYIRQKNIEREVKLSQPGKNATKLRLSINEVYERIQQEKRSKKEELLRESLREKEDNTIREQDEENDVSGNTSMIRQIIKSVQKEVDKKFEGKKKLYKEYFIFLSQKLDYKVCEFLERDETDEEQKKRLEEKELEEKYKLELLNQLKGKGKAQPKPNTKGGKDQKEEPKEEHIKVRELKMGSLDMSERYNKWSKWVTSQLQIIEDLQILDINVSII